MATCSAAQAVMTEQDQTATNHGRRATEFWQIPRKGWKDIAVRTWNETNADNISLLAAGVAFYSFLAFVPLLGSIVLIYGIAADPADVGTHMATLMRFLPTDAAAIIADQLKNLTATPVTRSALGLIFAFLLALYGAMRGATAIIGALNITYGEHETRSLVRTTLLSLAFTVGAVCVAVVATVAIGAMGLIGTVIHMPAFAGPVITAALWFGTAIVASALIAIVYRFGPDRRDARWTWLTPGAVFASVGALLATFLFGLYVSHFAGYNATYGALGAVVSFLMWLYVTAFVVLLGAELNAEIEHQTARDTTTGAERPMGQRRAKMADTVAAPADAEPVEDLTDLFEMAAITQAGNIVAAPATSRLKPIAAPFLAARASRWSGGLPVGSIAMGIATFGLGRIGAPGKTKTGLVLLLIGTAMSVRANRSTAAKSSFRSR
jgi:membrane protein